ncbi:MAG TPA: glycosyltransferase, partial [Chitinophagaceae bacterium]
INQQCDFDFEIVVGDDCSTDNTSEICRQFALLYPEKIRHIRNKNNLGYIKNLLMVFNECKGKFIAILEADDHWTSISKIADQVNVFKQNRNVSLCFTNSIIDDTLATNNKYYFKRSADLIFTAKDCLTHCVAPTSTFMFKKGLFEQPSWFTNLTSYEYFLIYLMADKGNIYYLNKITSCRTQHYRGQSTTTISNDSMMKCELIYLNALAKHYSTKNKKLVQNIILKNQIATISHCLAEKKIALVRELLPHVKILNLRFSKNGIQVFCSYVKLVSNYTRKKILHKDSNA